MTRPNPKVARGGKWRRVVRRDPPLPVQEVAFDFAVTAPSPNPGSERHTDHSCGPPHVYRLTDDGQMSAIGTKRTSACALHMFAFDPKRTLAGR